MTFQNQKSFKLSFSIFCFKFSCAYKKGSIAVNVLAPFAEEKALHTDDTTFISELSGASNRKSINLIP